MFNFAGVLGYEYIVCFNGVERLLFYDDVAEGSSFNEMMNYVLQGPYVHAGVAF